MAENETIRAIEPDDVAQPELDQPEDYAVSLNDLLDQEPTEQTEGEQENVVADDDQQEAESDAPQPTGKPGKALTQADVDRIIAERRDGFRRQFERERSDDLELAGSVKSLFPGLTLQQIEDRLLSVEAARLAAETGWDEEEALKKVRARHEYERYNTAKPVDPQRVKMLQKQLADIQKDDGIDFLEVVKADQFLAEQVDSGRMDIKDAYIHYLKQQKPNAKPAVQTTKRAAPPVEKSTPAIGVPARRNITDREFKAINDALKSGRPVRV